MAERAATATLEHGFTAPIEKEAMFLTVPDSVAVLQTGRAVKVTGTLDGHPFAATLMPSGSGAHWLPLRMALCTTLGTSAGGEPVAVRLEQRLT